MNPQGEDTGKEQITATAKLLKNNGEHFSPNIMNPEYKRIQVG